MSEKQIIIDHGRHCKTRNLIEQAAYTRDLAQQNLSNLTETGLTQALLDECDLLRNEIIELEGKQESAKDDVSLTTVNVYDRITEAKTWVKKTKLKAKRAFRLNRVVLDDFFNHQAMGRSVPNSISTLIKLIELQRKYDTELSAYGGGIAFADEGAAILTALQETDSNQEVTKTNLPASSEELYYKQGLLYFKLKDINDIAQEAFIDDPLKARNYTMSILKRGGTTRVKVEVEV